MLGLPDARGRALQVPDVYSIRAWLYSLYARDRWTVIPEPDSGVLVTDPLVLTGLSVPVDDDLTELMRRQAKWDSDG